jgi:hypothetical protein
VRAPSAAEIKVTVQLLETFYGVSAYRCPFDAV